MPDMLSAVDRKSRMRQKRVAPFADDADPFTRDLVVGILAHLSDDDWFHSGEPFLMASGRMTRKLRTLFPDDQSHRVGFLGHILVEILLDRWLIERDPTLLDRLHAAMETIDPAQLAAAVDRMATRPTERLASMYPRMVSERFLSDYPDDDRLLYRLNGVMKRVGLPLLPESFAEELPALHADVVKIAPTLLPPDVVKSIDFPH